MLLPRPPKIKLVLIDVLNVNRGWNSSKGFLFSLEKDKLTHLATMPLARLWVVFVAFLSCYGVLSCNWFKSVRVLRGALSSNHTGVCI